jgi:hypothetical protein
MTYIAQDFADSLAGAQPPCISLYQPTHRHHPGNQQDPIRFKNLVKEVEASLRQKYPAAEVSKLLKPLEELGADAAFWNHTLDGLAVFAAPGLFKVFTTQRTVTEFAVVADNFHTKPLRRILQTTGYYQVLCVSRIEIKLFEGNRHYLDEIELAPGVPRTVRDAVGWEGRTDDERFFRAAGNAVLEHHSRPSDLPLVLAILPEHHALFRESSRNPFMLEKSIMINPFALSNEQLRDYAWEIVEPDFHAKSKALIADFQQSVADGLGSEDLSAVAQAAASGRIKTLLIEADRHIPGRIDPVSGAIESGKICDPRVDDLLDDLGELTLDKGGKLKVLPTELMPTSTGLAAIYRF